jgi:hypothetical protein
MDLLLLHVSYHMGIKEFNTSDSIYVFIKTNEDKSNNSIVIS